MNADQEDKSIVCQVVSDILDVDEVADDATPSTVVGWDSIGHLLIVSALEVSLDVTFSPDDMVEMIGGVDAILAVVARKRADGR